MKNDIYLYKLNVGSWNYCKQPTRKKSHNTFFKELSKRLRHVYAIYARLGAMNVRWDYEQKTHTL